MALWSGPGATPSPRSPESCTWSLWWPALGPTLNAPFGVPKWPAGPFWSGWAWAWPGLHRGRWCAIPQGGQPGGPPGVKMLYNMSFLVDPSAPNYHHAGHRKRHLAAGVLSCALGPFGCGPWGRLCNAHLAHLNCAPGAVCGVLHPRYTPHTHHTRIMRPRYASNARHPQGHPSAMPGIGG